MFEETKSIDLIEILEGGNIQVREITRVSKDGLVIATQYFRYILNPGDDLTGQPEKIITIANVIWTEEIINNYQSLLSQSLNITQPII